MKTPQETETVKNRVAAINWQDVSHQLYTRGFVMVKNVLSVQECNDLTNAYDTAAYRKTISMERYRFGCGEYKYYRYPLPGIVTGLRESIYPHIVPVANRWMEESGLDQRFPPAHQEMIRLCHDNGQTKPTVLILKYGQGGFNTLHQDLYGAIYFPMQMVFLLDEVNEDYTGGELVITEQTPRAQSKASVLIPRKGDMVLFATNFRPVKGARVIIE